MKIFSATIGHLLLSASILFTTPVIASSPLGQAKTVIFVHGAFADGSSWNKVIPLLQAQGLKTVSVQNPLTSLQQDVAFTQRALAQAEGPVVLVGHSWGGMVITEAGNNEKVKSLVYVSAFAPSKGEHIHDILNEAHGIKKMAKVPGFAKPILDSEGYLSLSEETIIKYFASDITPKEAKLISASQGQLHKAALDQEVTTAAWETKPSWYIVSANDQMIAPDLMRWQAKKIGAKTTELQTSHVAMLVKPKAVAQIILEAANYKDSL